MPKKTQSRGGRGKARTRRPAPSPSASTAAAAPTAPSPVGASVAPARSRPGAPRRASGTTVNYVYLRHDLRTLAVLGPLMIVILVAAFFVLH